jgi:hypothetical protein
MQIHAIDANPPNPGNPNSGDPNSGNSNPGALISGLFSYSGPPMELALEPLQIDGKPIKFFCDSILKGCSFDTVQLTDSSLQLWRLRFFIGSRFASTLFVIRKSIAESELTQMDRRHAGLFAELGNAVKLDRNTSTLIDVGRMIWLASSDAFAPQAECVSRYLRGSSTLKLADFSERNGRKLVIDARGMGMIALGDHVGDIHARHTLLLALVRAYQDAFESASRELANLSAEPESASTSAKLSLLHRDSLVFAARYIFARPVRMHTVELRFVWEDLAQANHLQSAQAELSEQISAVHSLLQYDEEKRDQKRDSRNQFWLTLIGLSLALISLLGLVEITPTSLRNFWAAWFG